MKYVLSLVAFSTLLSFRQVDGIYGIAMKTIDGNKIELSQYKGKKLLFIVIPVSTDDATVSVSDIAQLQTKYQNSLVIIGVPSEEAGYKTQDAGTVKKIFSNATANIILAEGMKVKKGTTQSSLFQWLTNMDMNHHFDRDVDGVGSKFFVDEGGELYAVTGPGLSLTNPLIDRILTRSHGKSSKENKN